jgi:hypothetical protein
MIIGLRLLGIRLGLWLARLCGWTPIPPCRRPHLPEDDLINIAAFAVSEVERAKAGEPGPVKAREALRVLMNLLPERSTRDLNLLIELALARGE